MAAQRYFADACERARGSSAILRRRVREIGRVEMFALHRHEQPVQRSVPKLWLRLQQLRDLAQERLTGMAFEWRGSSGESRSITCPFRESLSP